MREHLFDELSALKRLIVRGTVIFFLFFFGLFFLGPSERIIGNITLPFVSFSSASFATNLFLFARETLLPEGISVVALGPVSSFLAPIMMAFLAAILILFPIGLLLLFRYLRPALKETERKTFFRFLFPAVLLFYCGCAVGFFIIIPQTFALLYSFSDPIGVAPFFALDDFVSSVFFLTISVGLAFLLPIGMAALSRSGVIPSEFWKRHFRGAVFTIVLFSAVVTPDGSGITMAFLALPLFGLYAIGIGAVGWGSKRS